MEKRIPYRVYKKTYPTAKTVPGSYDAQTKTIVIIMPESKPHLRFSPKEWEKTSANSKRLIGHMIKVYFWNSGAEAHFSVEATETEDGGRRYRRKKFVCRCDGSSQFYTYQDIPGYGPDARDAAITMAKELASTGKYIRSADFSPFNF